MGTRNDDISLKLAKAVKAGFLPDVYDNEVDILAKEATALFGLDATLPFNVSERAKLGEWHTKLRLTPELCKIAFVGDSTSDSITEAVAIYDRMKWHTKSDNALEGMLQANILAFGHNGSKQSDWKGNQSWRDEVTNSNADVVVYSYGLNDTRLGASSEALLKAALIENIEYLRARMPNTAFILRMPNPMLKDDPTATNTWVVPLASAQAYTTIMYNVYNQMVGYWPNVAVWNSHDRLFGRVVRDFNQTQGLFKDILHPSKTIGYPLIADYLVKDLIGLPVAKDIKSFIPIDMLQASRPSNPYVAGDLMDRVDNAASLGIASSGQTYVVDSGTGGILNKRVYMPSGTNLRASFDCGLANGEFGITISTVDNAAGTLGLVFRYQDATNYWLLRASSNSYRLTKIIGGSVTDVVTVVSPPVNGDRIRVNAQGTNIKAYINDLLIAEADSTDVQTATKIGFQCSSLTARLVDLFARKAV